MPIQTRIIPPDWTEDPDIPRAVNELQKIPILDGRLIENIALATGTRKVINHGLGRRFRGYIVVRRDAGAIIWSEDATDESKELWLQASANVNINLWIF